jgi:hypothetical protein
MDEKDFQIEFAVLKERLNSVIEQMKRLVSHVESEQRQTVNMSKRIEFIEKTILKEKDNNRWNVTTIVSIVSIIFSTVLSIIMILRT